MKVLEIVKDNIVYFNHFKDNELIYHVEVKGEAFQFPIPIKETKGGTFLSQDKAILFMRFINIALKEGTFLPV